MKFDTWRPVYEAILADFGYDRGADERARDRLADLATPFGTTRLADLFEEQVVALVGAAPSLRGDLADGIAADVTVAASAAADVLLDHGVEIDLVVTDLDKTPETALSLATDGVPVAVHAHGDNTAAIDRWVGRFPADDLLGTTQARPVGPVRNFGGFTDGDRGAFLAHHFGAAAMTFPGWDFEDDTVGDEKARKLAWAERLLEWLERRRGDRFPVLDGRRSAIDPLPL
jgi:uncharacterized Rossmann fold enzyme